MHITHIEITTGRHNHYNDEVKVYIGNELCGTYTPNADFKLHTINCDVIGDFVKIVYRFGYYNGWFSISNVEVIGAKAIKDGAKAIDGPSYYLPNFC